MSRYRCRRKWTRGYVSTNAWSTTTLNAYSMPRMHRYMSRLDAALKRKEGIKYLHSGGGVIPSATAERFPI